MAVGMEISSATSRPSRLAIPMNPARAERTNVSEYQTIDSAPRDGTAIQARVPGYGDDYVIAWAVGFENEDGGDCGTWAIFEEGEDYPDDWTDGVCWDSNAAEMPSTRPTHWKPLPTDHPANPPTPPLTIDKAAEDGT